MRLILLLIASLLLLSTATAVGAETSATTPTPRDVAERMQACVGQPFQIADLGASGASPDVLVTTPAGVFGIKEIVTPRLGNAAAIMLSRNPRYALLYLTFAEQIGHGYVNLDRADDFQRAVVDCFYGAYIGQDVVR